MVERLNTKKQKNERAPCLSVLRACTAEKWSNRTQVVNVANPGDGVTKGLLLHKQSAVVDGFLIVEQPDVWHREFLQPRRGKQRGNYALTLLCTLRSQSIATVLCARRGIM